MDNVSLGLQFRLVDLARRRQPVEDVARMLGLREVRHPAPKTVSVVLQGGRDEHSWHDEVQVPAALPKLWLGRVGCVLHVDGNHLVSGAG